LLHGRVLEAFRLNGLFVLLLPLAAAYGGASVWQALTGRDRLRSIQRPAVVWLFVAVAIVFAVVRNFAFAFRSSTL
jgi:hypothetical protein